MQKHGPSNDVQQAEYGGGNIKRIKSDQSDCTETRHAHAGFQFGVIGVTDHEATEHKEQVNSQVGTRKDDISRKEWAEMIQHDADRRDAAHGV